MRVAEIAENLVKHVRSGIYPKETLTMGTFTVSFQMGNLAGQQFIEVEGLVDTGANYTSIPESTLAQLGIEKRESAPLNSLMTGLLNIPWGTPACGWRSGT